MKVRRSIAVRLALIGGITIVLVIGWVVYGRFASNDRRFQQIREIRDRIQLLLDRDTIRDEDLRVVSTDGTAVQCELLVPRSHVRLARPNVALHGRVPFICEPASLAGNGRYVLLVDGSVDRVSDEKLRELLVQSGSPAEAIERLFVKHPGP
ncbi:MAG: hypothetical protein IT450_11655 [Phycisphaerales bacterium]|nr:hypothetical protein [Phycisphaerales bacterium]